MTIIFCFTRIFRNSHRKIFQFDKLIEEGHDVKLLDLTHIYGGNPTCNDDYMLNLRTRCLHNDDLISFKENLDSEPAIYVCNDTYLMFARGSFEILVRKQDKLLAFQIKPSPFQFTPDNLVKKILRKLFKTFKKLPFYFKSIYLSNRSYYAPDYYMCTTEYDLPLKAFFTVKHENIFIVHSDDANYIVQDKTDVSKNERIGVFLDQILPIAFKDMAPKNFDHYYDRLTLTLEELKTYFELDKIIIAEHPESVTAEEELRDKFEGWERTGGKTQQLVKNATYVFAHYSTSIGMAAYYKKPIILLLDKDLEDVEWIYVAVNTYKDLLNLPVIDMVDRNLSQLDKYEVNETLYNNYVKKFVKDNDEVKENSYHYAIKRIIKDMQKRKKI
ncbi:hypothetical protein JRG66_01075 [Salinimicrobium tongyeongense]|uniref:CDP-Glycerol:Poly(Glycerophosphate) glycerophosphotransferase n=1 Tax=Salinimicrobium tongyeongense TaxID=2809707 RepID=A0ABY6NRH6_9FLAO|nr:hypothetical protein [Salinimicrobium tongyeongense]UZH55520.1 hypothetical protein JRG66_01075 [Salinimicrobium tongyeongense]